MAKYLLSSGKIDIIVGTKDFKKLYERYGKQVKDFMLYDKDGMWIDSGYTKNKQYVHDSICPDGRYRVLYAYVVRTHRIGFTHRDIDDYIYNETKIWESFHDRAYTTSELERELNTPKEHGGLGRLKVNIYDNDWNLINHYEEIPSGWEMSKEKDNGFRPIVYIEFPDKYKEITSCYAVDYKQASKLIE